MMRVRVEIGTDVSEKEIVLRTNEYDEEVERMLSLLQKIQKTPQLIFYKDSTEYFFSADKILFFETSERQVYAHTKNDVFVVKHRLYELEDILSGKFMRISKSTIVNLSHVYAFTQSLSGCSIQFANTHKQVYVSRRYYKLLRERMKEVREKI